MATITGSGDGRKSGRKHFVIHSAAWLDQHQPWISDGARQLYKTLVSLADARSGRLFIAGRGWIPLRAIERTAGICDETRKKRMRELTNLGAIKCHRDSVTRVIGGRKRWVLGIAQITVLPLDPPKVRGSSTAKTSKKGQSPDKTRLTEASEAESTNRNAVSSTAKSAETSFLEPQDYISSTAKSEDNPPEKSKVVLQELNSSTAVDFSRQYLSNPTIQHPLEGAVGVSAPLPSVAPPNGAPPSTASRSEAGSSEALEIQLCKRHRHHLPPRASGSLR